MPCRALALLRSVALGCALAGAALGAATAATAASAATATATAAAATPAPASAEIALQPAQVIALGLRSVRLGGDGATAPARYPATVVLPPGQQRVVAAALPGLVEALRVSVGDSVRAGQPLALLRSAQAQELQRDTLTSASQAGLAQSAAARDERLHAEGLIPLARLEASRAGAAQAQAQADERRRALALSGGAAEGGAITLSAPIAGVVLERLVAVGQRVDAATAVYRIGSLAPLWLELQVPAAAAAAIRTGDKVSAVGHAASGRVIALAPVVDPASQTLLVRAELRTPPAGLRVGQALEAQLDSAGAGVAQVAAAALIDHGGPRVFVDIGAGRYRAVPVQQVGSAGGLVALRGLAADALVVVQGTAALKALLTAAKP